MEQMSESASDPVLKVLRPLVETSRAFQGEDRRHIRSMGLTPSQFNIVAALGDTDGMISSELSEATLLTKGTLTGVLDRLEAKGLIERAGVPADRRRTLIRLTKKRDELFRMVLPAHMTHLKPFFERALTPQDATQLNELLPRLRESFRGGWALKLERGKGESFFSHMVLIRTMCHKADKEATMATLFKTDD